MPPEKGTTHRKHLKYEDRFRIRVLYFDAKFGPAKIRNITGFSENQIRYAIRCESAQVGRRSGRPKASDKADAADHQSGGDIGAADSTPQAFDNQLAEGAINPAGVNTAQTELNGLVIDPTENPGHVTALEQPAQLSNDQTSA
ncbi:hypothetical protein QBC46DRAFT_407041 [Diplogelasinospora grovesii]|uniref:Transposase n=1 Tax=Diplogelasinospora grovesii TaxID=303347 RepID=A0AAN6NCL9_9PEZI|nr:hypothetical protein QBC46DRAFT_407041 [Diplogelasinospora grovesii]